MTSTIKIAVELNDNGTLKLTTTEAKKLEKALADGNKAAVLLSKGISDPAKAKALQDTVDNAKALTREINKITSESKAAARALDSIKKSSSTLDRIDKGLNRGTAAGNTRGDSRDFARQAQGMGGLVHTYATFAANIWAVTAAYQGLAKAYEAVRLEEAGKMLSATLGISMKNLAKDIQTASGYSVSFKEAMQFGALGVQAGLTTKQITGLTQAAKGAANVLGRDVNDAITRMIRGTAKMEQEILDELGIFVRAKDAYKAYAKEQGYTSEATLTQTQRVQAYAEAVEKASEKYKKFAEIDDPFAKLSATISQAGTELLNLVNKAVVPVINKLSESGKLVETLLLGGATYLLKMALPAIQEFQKKLFDNSAALAAADAAKKNHILKLTHDLTELQAKTGKIDFTPLGDNLARSIGKGIKPDVIIRAINRAFGGSKTFEEFEQNLTKSVEKTAGIYKANAAKAFKAGNIEGQQQFLQMNEALKTSQNTIILAIKEKMALETDFKNLIEKENKSLADQARLMAEIDALEKQKYANNRAGRAAERAVISGDTASKIATAGIGGLLAGEGKAIAAEWASATKHMTVFGRTLTFVSTAIKVTSAVIGGLMSLLNIGLMAWMAWDFVLGPLANKMGWISGEGSKLTNSTTKLTDAVTTSTESFTLYSGVLKDTPDDLQLVTKAHESMANSISSVGDQLKETVKIFGDYTANAGWIDKLGDLIIGVFSTTKIEDFRKSIEEAKISLSQLGVQDASIVESLASAQQALSDQEVKVRKTIDAGRKYTESNFGKGAFYQTNDQEVQIEAQKYNDLLKIRDDVQKKINDSMREAIKLQREMATNTSLHQSIIGAGNLGETLLDKKGALARYKFDNADLQAASDAQYALVEKMKEVEDAKVRIKDKGKLADPEDVALVNRFSKSVEEMSLSFDKLAQKMTDPAFREAYVAFMTALKTNDTSLLEGAATILQTIEQGYQAIETQNKENQKQREAAAARAERRAAAAKTALEEQDRLIAAARVRTQDSVISSLNAEINLEKTKYGVVQESTLAKINQAEQDKVILEYNLAKETSEKNAANKRKEKLLSEESILKTLGLENKASEDIKKQKLAELVATQKIRDTQNKITDYEQKISRGADLRTKSKQNELDVVQSIGLLSEKEYSNLKASLALEDLSNKYTKDIAVAKLSENESQIAFLDAEFAINAKKIEQVRQVEEIKAKESEAQALYNAELSLSNTILDEMVQGNISILDSTIIEEQTQKSITNLIALRANELADINNTNERNLKTEQSTWELAKQQFSLTKQRFELTKKAEGATSSNISTEMAYRVEELKKNAKTMTDGIVDAIFSAIDSGVDKLFEIIKSKSGNVKEIFSAMNTAFQDAIMEYNSAQLKLMIKDLITGKKNQTVEQIQEDISKNIISLVDEAREHKLATLKLVETIDTSTGSLRTVSVGSSLTSNSIQAAPDILVSKVIKNTSAKDQEIALNASDTAEKNRMLQTETLMGGLKLAFSSNAQGSVANSMADAAKNMGESAKTLNNSMTGSPGGFLGDIGTKLQMWGVESDSIFADTAKSIGSTLESVGTGFNDLLSSVGQSFGSILSISSSLANGKYFTALGTAVGSFFGMGTIGSIAGSFLDSLLGSQHETRPKYYSTTAVGPNNISKNIASDQNSDAKGVNLTIPAGVSLGKYIIAAVEKLGGKLTKSFLIDMAYMGKYNSTSIDINKSRVAEWVGNNSKVLADNYNKVVTMVIKNKLAELPKYLSDFIANINTTLKIQGKKALTSTEVLDSASALATIYTSLKTLPHIFRDLIPTIEAISGKSTLEDIQKVIDATKEYYSLFYSESKRMLDTVYSLRRGTQEAIVPKDINNPITNDSSIYSRILNILGSSDKEFSKILDKNNKPTWDTSTLYGTKFQNEQLLQEAKDAKAKLESAVDPKKIKNYGAQLAVLNNTIDSLTNQLTSNNLDISKVIGASGVLSQVTDLQNILTDYTQQSFHPEQAKQRFEDLLDGIDQTSIAGRELWLTVLNLGKSFSELVDQSHQINFTNVSKAFETQINLGKYLGDSIVGSAKKDYKNFLGTSTLGLVKDATLEQAQIGLMAYLNSGNMTEEMSSIWDTYFTLLNDSATTSINTVSTIWDKLSSGIKSLVDSFKQAKDNILSYRESLLLGDTSNLSNTDKLKLAYSTFTNLKTTVTSGTAGSEEVLAAIDKIPGAADALLAQAKTMYGSAKPYNDLFIEVTSLLDTLSVGSSSVIDQQLSKLDAQLLEAQKLVPTLNSNTQDIISSVDQLYTQLVTATDAIKGMSLNNPTPADLSTIGDIPIITEPAAGSNSFYNNLISSENNPNKATGLYSTISTAIKSIVSPTDLLGDPTKYLGSASSITSATSNLLKMAINTGNAKTQETSIAAYGKGTSNTLSNIALWLNDITGPNVPKVKIPTKGNASASELGSVLAQAYYSDKTILDKLVEHFGIPKFALGGYASQGLALVGEKGPELVDFKSPARVYTTDETGSLMGASVNNNLALLNEIKMLKEELKQLRLEQQKQIADIINHNYNANEKAADKVVKGTKDSTEKATWTNTSRPVLV